MSKNEVVGLYRSLLRVQRRWPAQEGRKFRLGLHIRRKIRDGFRDGATASGSEANKLIAKAREELTALSSLLEGLAQKEFPLSKDSHIPAFLPSKSTFQLLDEYAQEAISPKNISAASFFPSYISAQWRKLTQAKE